MNNIGSRNYIMARRRAATLGDTWYEKAGKGILNIGESVLNWYTGSQTTEAYQQALSAVTAYKPPDYTKYILIGGGVLAAIILLKNNRK